MIRFTKILSIIVFKRYFETTKFILFFPKLCFKLLNSSYINLKKYVLEYSYNFNLTNLNFSNLIFILYSDKDIFLKVINQYYLKLFAIKHNNIYFPSKFLVNNKFLFLFSLKKFLFQIKYIFYSNLKYIYSFIRFYK